MTLIDTNAAVLDKAREVLAKQTTSDALTTSTEFETLAECDLVVEAAFDENEDKDGEDSTGSKTSGGRQKRTTKGALP